MATLKKVQRKAAKPAPRKIKSPAKKATAKASAKKSTAKKAASKVMTKKAPAKKVMSAKRTASKKAAPVKKGALKKVASTKKRVAVKKVAIKKAAPTKKTVAKKTNAPKATNIKLSKTTKPQMTSKPAAVKKPAGTMPKVAQTIPVNQHTGVSSVLNHITTDETGNTQPTHITTDAVETTGIPADHEHGHKENHDLSQHHISPKDIATVGVNNKREILENTSLKHANSHKITNQKIAGKKPLW